jgi:hypothetical protein
MRFTCYETIRRISLQFLTVGQLFDYPENVFYVYLSCYTVLKVILKVIIAN